MKKQVFLVFCLCLLSGCAFINSFDYDKEVSKLIDGYNVDHYVVFAEDVSEDYAENYSGSYRKLIKSVYENTSIELEQASDYSVTVRAIYFSSDEVFKAVSSDTTGFVHDVQNLYDLELNQSEINDYVYDYLYMMILNCNKEAHSIELELTQCTQAPLNFSSNSVLYDDITSSLNQLVINLEEYALAYGEDVSADVVISPEELSVGKICILNYSYDDRLVPISIKVTEVLHGVDTKNKLLELSENNRTLLTDNLTYVQYEVHNFSGEQIVLTNKFYAIDVESYELFSDDIVYVGINDACNVAACSTIVMSSIVVDNYGDLVWYDEQAAELYLLNQ